MPAWQRVYYLAAVRCLQNRPARTTGGPAKTRFDEFQLAHVSATIRSHWVGQFLPWHRQYVNLYAKALREECGYWGPTPYWDWSRDAVATTPYSESPLFHPVTGFGGNGVSGTYTVPNDPLNEIRTNPNSLPLEEMWKGCVQDGPFRDTQFKLNIGPGRMITEHCLVRGMDPRVLPFVTPDKVQLVLDAPTFEQHRLIGETPPSGIHIAGHVLIGGEGLNFFSSPGDPLFYLHHANLDRVWWKWQRANPATRLTDISGPTTVNGTTQVTLDYVMDFPGIGPNITVRETMDSYLQPNCFFYAD